MTKLRDKMTGRYQKVPQDHCDMAPVVPAPALVAAAATVEELKSHEAALRNRMTDMENEYEQLDKHVHKIMVDLDKARAEVQRLM